MGHAGREFKGVEVFFHWDTELIRPHFDGLEPGLMGDEPIDFIHLHIVFRKHLEDMRGHHAKRHNACGGILGKRNVLLSTRMKGILYPVKMKELWKKFDEVEMTHSSVHHLMAIYELLKKNGYVRGVDVAKYLDISRSSVSITMKKLISRGYVVEDENKFYKFTSQGEELINSVLSKRHIIKMFFEEVLGLSEELAEEEACKIEHLASSNHTVKV